MANLHNDNSSHGRKVPSGIVTVTDLARNWACIRAPF